MNADFARREATGSVTNAAFTRAAIFFRDRSHLTLEHSSRQNRWAKASDSATDADAVCLAMDQFRLNAKHLELFFKDGTAIEFHPVALTKGKRRSEMALPWDKRDFRTWREALAEGRLDPKQKALLQEMVDQGQATDLNAAAQMLDWQESVIDPDEHMYGV